MLFLVLPEITAILSGLKLNQSISNEVKMTSEAGQTTIHI